MIDEIVSYEGNKIMHPIVDESLCIACGACHDVCPADPNVFVIKDKSKVIHPEACIGCGQCVEACPTEAIELVD